MPNTGAFTVLVSRLLASSSAPKSFITHVVEESTSLIEDICSFMQYKTQSFAAAAGIPAHDEHYQKLMKDMEAVSHPFKNLQTDYKQKKYFQCSEAFVQPEELPLGVGYYPKNNRSTGNVQQVMKMMFQYIPIKSVMKLLLEKTESTKDSFLLYSQY